MVCENMVTIADIVYCQAGVLFGLNWLLFGLALLAMIAFFTYFFRFPAKVALVMGFALIYALDLFAGGSTELRLLLVLLGIGIGYVIIKGVLG